MHTPLFDELRRRVSPETKLLRDEPLAKRTTMRVGGPADLFIEPADEADLAAVLRLGQAAQMPLLVMGRGSNLLVKDTGFRGMVVCLAHPHFSRIEVSNCRLQCGAGARLNALAAQARRHGVGGLEFLEGIPGSVGGALRMNAGAMGRAISDALESVRFMDFGGRVEERRGAELGAQYRSCAFLETRVALSAVLAGEPADPQVIEARMNAFSRKRWKAQPAAASAGCVFKNPGSLPAGRLIEDLGFKGTRVGGAMVSHQHANFIVNTGGATAHDVLGLIDLIRHKARAERGIELETEVRIVGD